MHSKHGRLECAILNVLWNFEKSNIYTNSVKDVCKALNEQDESLRAYTTVKTVMDRLYKKEFLLRFKQKNKFYYRTVFSKKDMLNKEINRLADMYFEGNAQMLSTAVNGLVNARVEEELVEAV